MDAESTTITINLLHVWVVAKIACSVILTKWESKYPVYDGLTARPRKMHETARRWLYHLICNPELAILKTIPLPILWLRDGNKALEFWSPIQTHQQMESGWNLSHPSKLFDCNLCQDTEIWKMTFGKKSCQAPCSCGIRKSWERRLGKRSNTERA